MDPFLCYLSDKEYQANTACPCESLAPPRDVLHFLDFGNRHFVGDGVSPDDADGVSQELVAVLGGYFRDYYGPNCHPETSSE